MRRRLIILIAAVSVTFFIATATMALRSAMIVDILSREEYRQDSPGPTGWHYGQHNFASFAGRLDYQGFRGRGHSDSDRVSYSDGAQRGWWYWHQAPNNNLHMWLTPFVFDRQVSADGWRTDYHIGFAYLPMLLIWGLIAWGSLARLRRLRRLERGGHCLVCGYDLRATPDRCPECGHRPQAVRDASHGASGA